MTWLNLLKAVSGIRGFVEAEDVFVDEAVQRDVDIGGLVGRQYAFGLNSVGAELPGAVIGKPAVRTRHHADAELTILDLPHFVRVEIIDEMARLFDHLPILEEAGGHLFRMIVFAAQQEQVIIPLFDRLALIVVNVRDQHAEAF